MSADRSEVGAVEKRTKIICTLGPAVDSDEMLEELIRCGMNVARLNFSHGSHAEHAERIARVKRVREKLGVPTAIMLDTKGPEIRTGTLADGEPVALRAGGRLVLSAKDVPGDATCVSQTFPDLAQCVSSGTRILLDDGLISLRVDTIDGEDVVCTIENDGVLGQRKSVNVPGVSIPLPAVTEKDRQDLLFGIQHEVDYVAASFVRDGDGIRQIRSFLKENGGEDIRIISKVENADAVRNIADIVAVSDGVMVARGDLGVELPEYKVPYIQKKIIRLCNMESKPVITATQMLDSMIRNPRPTRAEVADVANAIYDGTDCIMLSGETAVGRHPVEAVRTMVEIAQETEPRVFDEHPPERARTHVKVSLAVGIAAVNTAEKLDAACIVAPTMSGRTARLISNLRPRMPIYAVTPFPRVMRQMQLSWGIVPLHDDVRGDMRHVIEQAKRTVIEHGLVEPGDLAVFTAGDPSTGPVEEAGSHYFGTAPANVMYVVQIRDE